MSPQVVRLFQQLLTGTLIKNGVVLVCQSLGQTERSPLHEHTNRPAWRHSACRLTSSSYEFPHTASLRRRGGRSRAGRFCPGVAGSQKWRLKLAVTVPCFWQLLIWLSEKQPWQGNTSSHLLEAVPQQASFNKHRQHYFQSALFLPFVLTAVASARRIWNVSAGILARHMASSNLFLVQPSSH